MGMGAASVFIKEYDLSDIVPSFKGVIGGIVIDAEKGKVNKKQLITSEKDLISTYGEPLPKKFGLGIYSALNFLKSSNKLWVVRVDKGQTYSSLLVRSKIYPLVEYDAYGYLLDTPVVDPIIKPLGALTAEEIEDYQFIQYPSTREVESMVPPVCLIDVPSTGDTIFNIDNSSPITVGSKITFKDTTGMSREDTLQYSTFTVLEKKVETVPIDYIKIEGSINSLAYNTPVQHTTYFFNSVNVKLVNIDHDISDQYVYLTYINPLTPFSGISELISTINNRTFTFEGNNTVIKTVNNSSQANYASATVGIPSNVVLEKDSVNELLFKTTQNMSSYVPGRSSDYVVTSTAGTFNHTIHPATTGTSTVNEIITVTFTSEIAYTVTGSVSNSMGTGSKSANFTVLNTLTIPSAGFSGTWEANDTVVFNVTANGANTGSIVLNGLTHTIASISKISNTWNISVAALQKPWNFTTSVDFNSFGAEVQSATLELNTGVSGLFDSVFNLVTGRYRLDITVDGVTYELTPKLGWKTRDIIDAMAVLINASQTLEATSIDSHSKVLIKKIATVQTDNVEVNVSISIFPVVYTLDNTDVWAVKLTGELPIAVNAGAETKFSSDVSTEISAYLPNVVVKQVVPGTTDTLRINNNDPIAENDWISINGIQYRVISKWQFHNNINTITVDRVYTSEVVLSIGSEVLFVSRDDFEHHDAILVSAYSPGEWGNKIAIAIRDSINYEDAFWMDVYYDGNKVEEWEVTRSIFRDGFGRQLFLEDKINIQSSYIQVKNNEFMVDEDGVVVEPLKTTRYIRQPVKTPIYTPVTTVVETVWDGDNRIRIPASEIYNIDVLKPVKLQNGVYNISSLGTSSAGGPLDTIVLQTGVSLGLNSLPPLDRHTEIGANISQYFNRSEIVDVSLATGINLGDLPVGHYSIKIAGTAIVAYEKTYFYDITVSSSGNTNILEKLTQQINTDLSARVVATLVDLGNDLFKTRLVSKQPGVDILVTVSNQFTNVLVQGNSREYQIYRLELISNSILPMVSIGDKATINKLDYTIYDAGSNKMSGGNNADYPTIGQFLIALDTVFTDPEEVDFLVLLDGSITAKAYQQRLVEICATRQDSIALLSVDFDAQANPDLTLGVLDYRANLNINSSYAAVYSPWTQVYDKYNDFKIWISPESWASRAISWISSNRELWYAPAGWDHASVSALEVYRKYTSGERDILYDNQINSVRFAPNKGLVLWGQKTLQTKPSALDRINVRMLLIVIERGLREYLEYKVFVINDETTRTLIKDVVSLYLQDIKVRRGLYDFNVVCDNTNNTSTIIDRNEMFVDVYLQPIRIAEYITARVVLTRTGANFNEIKL